MKCAVYARYSSDNQKETSIEDHIRECTSFIEQQGWTLLDEHVYTDYAVSGADTNRPGYLALKDASRQGFFEAVIVDDLSRLGRDAGESISAYKEFQVFGIRIVCVADGIDTSKSSGKLRLYFKGIMNEVFLDDLRDKVRRGLKGQVLRGYSAGGHVFGYKYTPEYDPTGAIDKFGRPKRIGVRIEIDEEQAAIIREVFQLAKEGYGCRHVSRILNERKVPTPQHRNKKRTGYWSVSSVHYILNQRKYIGDWTWNKSRMVKMPDRKRRVELKIPKTNGLLLMLRN